MKYAEGVFDILYLVFALVSGIVFLATSGAYPGRVLMGIAVLVLGAGDAFHLVPRIRGSFGARGLDAALGRGMQITSITMTAFYVLLYFVWAKGTAWHSTWLTGAVFTLALARVVLCLLPQNRWREGGRGQPHWNVYRNIPFFGLGAIVAILYLTGSGALVLIGAGIVGSFLFYAPVIFWAGKHPKLGMLMLPKTLMYVAIILLFYQI
jgi:hypothetical protein